jgi:hypothetical protein
VLECPELDGPAAGAPSPAEFPVLLANNCSAAVEVKAAYSLPEGADASACVIDQWQGKDKRLCVTGWREVEAGGELLVGGTTDTFWAYGAHLAGGAPPMWPSLQGRWGTPCRARPPPPPQRLHADPVFPRQRAARHSNLNPSRLHRCTAAADPAYDLAELSAGAFQRANDTTPCPEEDAYGSGYVCEWWAPVSGQRQERLRPPRRHPVPAAACDGLPQRRSPRLLLTCQWRASRQAYRGAAGCCPLRRCRRASRAAQTLFQGRSSSLATTTTRTSSDVAPSGVQPPAPIC